MKITLSILLFINGILLLLWPVYTNYTIISSITFLTFSNYTYLTRNYRPLFLLSLFISSYLIVFFLNAINPELSKLSLGYKDFDSTKLHTITVYCLSLFLFTFILSTTQIWRSEKQGIRIIIDALKIKNDKWIFYLLILISNFLTIFGRNGGSIFQPGEYYGSTSHQVQNLGGLAIFEYNIIFFLLAFIFSNREKKKIWIINISALIYMTKAISLGGRIETLQVLLLYFILFIDRYKISFKKLGFLGIISFLLLVFFGYLRSFSGEISPNTIYKIIENIISTKPEFLTFAFLGNQIDIIYSSARLNGLIAFDYLNSLERFQIFIYNIWAILAPYSLLPSTANIAILFKDKFPSGGGGLISTFYYLQGSSFLIILMGAIIGRILTNAFNSKTTNQSLIVYAIMILCTFPRWFGYNPITLFKLCIYPVIILYIIKVLKKSYGKNSISQH